MFLIRSEAAHDAEAVEALCNQGFGPERFTKTVYKLRHGDAHPDLSHVAVDPLNDQVLATLRFWQVQVGEEEVPALLLGPLAVDPALQGQGIGRALVGHGMQVARDLGESLVLVVGAPRYYQPFGFEPAQPYNLLLPGPVEQERFQLCPLNDKALGMLSRERINHVSQRRGVRPGGSGRLNADIGRAA